MPVTIHYLNVSANWLCEVVQRLPKGPTIEDPVRPCLDGPRSIGIVAQSTENILTKEDFSA